MSRINRILLAIVIILAVVTAMLWFFPDVLSSLSALNPFSGREETLLTTEIRPTTQPAPTPVTDPDSTINDNNYEELIEEELTPFEKEIKQRHESYQTKIYTYIPYEPPVLRNPFQRIISTVYVGDEEEERLARELSTEDAVRRFVQPELPPGSKFTGIISAGEDKLAILEIDNETYIVKQGDLIMDKYLIKLIQDDKLVIDINGFEISLQLGGGEATNG